MNKKKQPTTTAATNLAALQIAAPFGEFCDQLFAIAEEVGACDMTDGDNFEQLIQLEALVREVADIATTKLRACVVTADRPLVAPFGELVIAMAGTRQVTDQVRFGDGGLDAMLDMVRRMEQPQ